MDYSLQKKTQEGYQVIEFFIFMSFVKYSCRARLWKTFSIQMLSLYKNQPNLCLLVKKLPSRDVSDVMSRHQKPLLVFLSLSFWPRSNKSQRYELICLLRSSNQTSLPVTSSRTSGSEQYKFSCDRCELTFSDPKEAIAHISERHMARPSISK